MKEKEARELLDQLTNIEMLALYDFLNLLHQTGNSQEGAGRNERIHPAPLRRKPPEGRADAFSQKDRRTHDGSTIRAVRRVSGADCGPAAVLLLFHRMKGD